MKREIDKKNNDAIFSGTGMTKFSKKLETENYDFQKLPNDFFAEQAILNILLTNPMLIPENAPYLKEDNFYFEPHRIIYRGICDLLEKNKTISLTKLLSHLQTEGNLEKIGGVDRLLKIVNQYENFVELSEYIELTNEKVLRRAIIKLGKKLLLEGYSSSFEFQKILQEVDQFLLPFGKEESFRTYAGSEILDTIFSDLSLQNSKTPEAGYLTNYEDLDSIVQGFQKSDLIIIAGRPSMGKTAFALNIGQNICEKYQVPILLFTLEMSKEQIMYRLVAKKSKINTTKFKTKEMSQQDWGSLTEAMQNLSELPFYINDNSNLTLGDIRAEIKKTFVDQNQSGIVIIDYLQLMKLPIKLENRAQEISYLTQNLKSLAREFKLPILLLSQLNRGAESRPNKRPVLSDLRDSGSIEQDADLVLMLYREDYYVQQKSLITSTTEIIVAKHRNGPIGSAYLRFYPNITSFENSKS